MKRIVALLLLLPLPAAAQEHVIDIFRPEKVVHPIAIVSFTPDEAVADPAYDEGIPDQIGKDLEFTGLFRVLDRKAYLEAKDSVKPTGVGTKWEDWRVLKADVLVRGAWRKEASGKLSAKVWVFNVADGSEIGEQQISEQADHLLFLQHRVANAVYKILTGEDGPFGSMLAWINDRSGAKELWIGPFDGTGEHQVTRNRSINLSPSWSPDGGRVAFTSFVRAHPDLYLWDRRLDKFFRVSDRPGINIGAVWSPLGHVMAVTLSDGGNPDVYLMGEDGKGAKKLTDSFAADCGPTWSPDGRKIAFMSDRGGAPNIYVMNADGSSPTRITFPDSGAGADNQAPNWAPRGDRIAFQSRVGGQWQVFTVTPDGKQTRQLTSAGTNEDPTFSPDGRMIAFVHSGRLWVMEADGTDARELVKGPGNYSNPAWSRNLW